MDLTSLFGWFANELTSHASHENEGDSNETDIGEEPLEPLVFFPVDGGDIRYHFGVVFCGRHQDCGHDHQECSKAFLANQDQQAGGNEKTSESLNGIDVEHVPGQARHKRWVRRLGSLHVHLPQAVHVLVVRPLTRVESDVMSVYDEEDAETHAAD